MERKSVLRPFLAPGVLSTYFYITITTWDWDWGVSVVGCGRAM